MKIFLWSLIINQVYELYMPALPKSASMKFGVLHHLYQFLFPSRMLDMYKGLSASVWNAPLMQGRGGGEGDSIHTRF